jgi:hypothetical protein
MNTYGAHKEAAGEGVSYFDWTLTGEHVIISPSRQEQDAGAAFEQAPYNTEEGPFSSEQEVSASAFTDPARNADERYVTEWAFA